MTFDDHDGENGFILKRKGEFRAALLAYARRYDEALREGNEYIARMCSDQLVDTQLLQFLKEGKTFSRVAELKRSIQTHVAEVLHQAEASQGSFKAHFDRSWDKFPRQKDGHPLFSVRREQLVDSRSDLEA